MTMNTNAASKVNLTAEQMVEDRTTITGFWLYLMTDLVLFASLFAVFAVMRAENIAMMGPMLPTDAPYVLIETLLLLTSSFSAGFALMAARAKRETALSIALVVSLLLGAAFLYMELSEFAKLAMAGNSWQASGYLSSYFTLVGTHGLHIFAGLLWGISLIIAIGMKGLTRSNMRKLALWALFWHFLDIVWIFIFTVVYLQNLT